MNSSPSEGNSRKDGPLTYEPEFAYYDGAVQEETSSGPVEDSTFAGLPDLEPSDEVGGLPNLDDAPEAESDSSEGMSFDDDFSDGLEDMGDFSDFGSDPAENVSDEAELPEEDPDDELLEGLDDSEDEATPEDEGEEDDAEDDDASSAGEIAKTAGAALAAGAKKGLSSAQKLLSKLPLVGKFVTSAARAGIALVLVIAIPVALVIVSSAITRSVTAPEDTASVSLPDNGGVEMSAMKLSDDGKKLTATLSNTGDVIADVTPSATLKAVDLSNPISWYVRKDVGSCKGELANIDIEASVEVTLKCDSSDGDAVPEGALK